MSATTLRNVRVVDDLWEAAKKRAASEGLSLSEVIRGMLQDYAAGEDKR